MAKFRLKASLIPKLTERSVISPTTGKIKMRIPYKENRITGEKCYEIEFLPTDVLETANEFTASVLRVKASPRIKIGAEWFIADPVVTWFDEIFDATPSNLVIEAATEVLLRRERRVLREYAKDLGLSLPAPMEKTQSNQALLSAARQHVFNKGA